MPPVDEDHEYLGANRSRVVVGNALWLGRELLATVTLVMAAAVLLDQSFLIQRR